ncbi:MAG: glycosyltransferase family 4 protein [Candidatus Babeliales bacterium]|jgi:glycosyltransferase involved in cell wall biosynthesis
MKVLVISHTYISPINRDKWKLCAYRHPTVTILVIYPRKWPSSLFSHQSSPGIEQIAPNCSCTALDTHGAGNELLYVYKSRQLRTILKKFRPDIVHVEQGAGALCYFQVNFFLRILKIKARSIFFTWINLKPQLSFKNRLYLKFIEKINMHHADGAITGNHDAQTLLQQKGFHKPILVLPQLGVNPEIFKPEDLPTNISRAHKYVGYIGRFTEEKGIFYLARAFMQLAANFPQWKLTFIGKGVAENRLHSFIAHRQMFNRIELCKPVPHETIAQYLRKLDILVLPSYDTPQWREQFGHILIEAMASGVAVIGSNAGQIPHVIKDSGLIFMQRNEADLIEKLQTLMQDEVLRKKIADAGRIRAHAEYSHEVIADKTYEFWHTISNT